MSISAGITTSQLREWKNVGRRGSCTGIGFACRRTAALGGLCCAFGGFWTGSCSQDVVVNLATD
jgi:hypothetical protein